MPISSISGLAGTVGGMSDPAGLEAFADHLQRAQQQRRQDAWQQLNFIVNLEKETGFMPDTKMIDKLVADIGLPKGLLTGGTFTRPAK